MGFLNQLFKHREPGDPLPGGEDAAAKAGEAVVLDVAATVVSPAENPFLHPKDPPSRFQPPVIHPPRGIGAVVRNAAATSAAPKVPAVMTLELGDILSRVPEQFVRPGTLDLRQVLNFDGAEVAAAMARGRVEIPLSRIAEQCPQAFFISAYSADEVLVRLPLQKLVEQMGSDVSSPVAAVESPRVELPVPDVVPANALPAVPEVVELKPPVPEPPVVITERPPVVELVAAPEPESERLPEPEPEPVVEKKPEPVVPIAPPQKTQERPASLPANDGLVMGPLRVQVRASVSDPLQASLRPVVLGASLPQPEIAPAHAAASQSVAIPQPVIRPVFIQPPPIRPVVVAQPVVASISEPAPLFPLPVDQSVTPPAKPQPAPPSEPPEKCDPRFESLQPIFMTDEPLDLAGVARCVAALPGVTACQISHGSERANGGNFPPGFHSENLQSLAPELAASADEAASRIQIGEVQNVTLHSAAQSVSIFTRGEVILGVLLGRRGFVPGVRERIAQAVDALAVPTE